MTLPHCAHSRRHGFRAAAFAALAAAALSVPPAEANTPRATVSKVTLKNSRPAVRPALPPLAMSVPARPDVPVVVRGTAPNQAGYLHFFVIIGPDGEAIHHVGVELPGDRIASSFPDDGVSIAPFFREGALTTTAGHVYQVEHLYGIRPFGDAAMGVLQRELTSRVQPWIDARTPYCDELTPSAQACVSCLSFAMSVLYPDGLPRDFKGAQKNMFTTEDLLMYLVGVPVDAPREVRQKRIAALAVPNAMREELARISGELDTVQAAEAAKVQRERPATANLPKRVLTRRRS